jgi:hypothetical protein
VTHDHVEPVLGCADCQAEARRRLVAEHAKPTREFVERTVAEIREKLKETK